MKRKEGKMKTLAYLANGRRIKRIKSMEVPKVKYWNFYECYPKPSKGKAKAWHEIVKAVYKNNGKAGVLSFNQNFFTCGGYVIDEKYRKVHFILTEKYLYYTY